MGDTTAMVDGILDLAKQEAASIEQAARAKAEAIAAKARQELDARRTAIAAQAGQRIALEERRIATKVELESRRELLKAKVDLMDEVFAAADDELARLPEEEWRALVRRLLLASTATKDEAVTVPTGQKERFASLLPQVNRELAELGRKGELERVEESSRIEAGFMLTTRDYTVDCSFRTLIDEHRPRLEPEVARLLFEEGMEGY